MEHMEITEKEKIEELEKFEQENDLPQLEGSKKQVHWARFIRRGYIQSFRGYVDFKFGDKIKPFEIMCDLMEEWFKTEKNAAIWIESRLGKKELKIRRIYGGKPFDYPAFLLKKRDEIYFNSLTKFFIKKRKRENPCAFDCENFEGSRAAVEKYCETLLKNDDFDKIYLQDHENGRCLKKYEK